MLYSFGIFYPAITKDTTCAREMLSVPAQQIARVAAYHEEELTKQDLQRLTYVWGEDSLPEYM